MSPSCSLRPKSPLGRLVEPALSGLGEVGRGVVRYGLAQDLERPARLLAPGVEDHGVDQFGEVEVLGWAHALRDKPEDHRVLGLLALLTLLEELLSQLLTGAEADEL